MTEILLRAGKSIKNGNDEKMNYNGLIEHSTAILEDSDELVKSAIMILSEELETCNREYSRASHQGELCQSAYRPISHLICSML
jgi:hypothetical protein